MAIRQEMQASRLPAKSVYVLNIDIGKFILYIDVPCRGCSEDLPISMLSSASFSQPACQSASQSVSLSLVDILTSASRYGYLSLTDRLTFIKDLFRFRRHTTNRKLDSTYITECEDNWQPASQPMRQPVSQSVLDSLTSASQSVYLSLPDILTFINDLFRFRRYKDIRKMVSTFIT